VSLLAHCLLLLDLLLGLEGELADQPVDLGAVLLLLLLELCALLLALCDFALDDLGQLLLLVLAGLAAVDDLVHETGHVVLEGVGDLLHYLRPLFLLFLYLAPQQLQLPLHRLHQVVLLLLALRYLPFDLAVQLEG
jgi:hypothetical protein